MRERWNQMVPVTRAFMIVGFCLIPVSVAVLILARLGLVPLDALLPLTGLLVLYALAGIPVAAVARRQEIDAAVRQGRAWDAEHPNEGDA